MKKSTGYLMRIKNEIPFSHSLNAYIEGKFDQLLEIGIDFNFVPNDPYFIDGRTIEENFAAMQQDFKHGFLQIWTGASENTIFGSPEINWKFRAIHDYFHCIHGLGFNAGDELLVNYLQLQEFTKDGLSGFDRQLLNIETAGQILHFTQTGEFPSEQRKFTIQELIKLGY